MQTKVCHFKIEHNVLPFLITGIVFIHYALLQKDGPNNPLGAKTPTLSFYPYFYLKDLCAFFILLTLLIWVVSFLPNTMGHPDNYYIMLSLLLTHF